MLSGVKKSAHQVCKLALVVTAQQLKRAAAVALPWHFGVDGYAHDART